MVSRVLNVGALGDVILMSRIPLFKTSDSGLALSLPLFIMTLFILAFKEHLMDYHEQKSNIP